VEKRKASAFVGNQRPAGRQNLMENVVWACEIAVMMIEFYVMKKNISQNLGQELLLDIGRFLPRSMQFNFPSHITMNYSWYTNNVVRFVYTCTFSVLQCGYIIVACYFIMFCYLVTYIQIDLKMLENLLDMEQVSIT
jgi:hypothetical protein